MLPPLTRQIVVPCDQQTAFRVFIEDLGRWWPAQRFSTSAMQGEAPQSITVDARVGGRIVEVMPDGTETLWGVIDVYEPCSRLQIDFHIPRPDEVRPEPASVLELTFTELGPRQTRVELWQSNWEVFAERAKLLQGGYGGGWAVIFEQAYAAACTRPDAERGVE